MCNMSWKDKTWKAPVIKLNEGPNGVLFLNEGEEVKGQYGAQVLFRVQPTDLGGKPEGVSGDLYIGSGVLLEALKSYPVLTGRCLYIIKTGTGADTLYELKEKL